jgi:negative regulator of sigma-B (phosphoserine phosphatase)
MKATEPKSRHGSAVRINIQTAHVSSPKPGERENGDAVLVRRVHDEQTLLAVIDGLGHGPDAAEAARAAVNELESLPPDTLVLDAMQAMHRALRGTRGAAATLCVVQGTRMETCAVGNVALLTVNCDLPLVLSAGILGHQVAKFRISSCELRPGARIALLSDGISTRFRLEELRHLAPAQVCDFIFGRHRRQEDDATVLVADVRA